MSFENTIGFLEDEFFVVAGLEKEVFGSVTFRLVVFPPPLWHEANEAMSAARMNRAIHFNCFRIPNASRTDAGCKPAKRVSERNQKVAHRSIFGVVWLYGQKRKSAVE
jgi:hypothetical protein